MPQGIGGCHGDAGRSRAAVPGAGPVATPAHDTDALRWVRIRRNKSRGRAVAASGRGCRDVVLTAKSGSGLAFQVFVRWNEKPWSRRMRPSVVACSSLTTPHRTKWVASFRRDHTVNGSPRSCGRVPATSSIILMSSSPYFDGRPDGLRGRSASNPPALNSRISSRTYSSWRCSRWAISPARIPCPKKATPCARRRYVAVFAVFKTCVRRRPSRAVSSRTYRHTWPSFGSYVCPYWITKWN